MTNIVSPQNSSFTLADGFRPAKSGTLYIGKAGTDPTISNNQITVNGRKVDGAISTLTQPISLDANGKPMDATGASVDLLVDTHYSFAVYDAYGKLSQSVSTQLVLEVDGFATLRSLPVIYEGQRVTLLGWNKGTNIGGGIFIGHRGTKTDDGGVIASGAGFYWERINFALIDISFFGAIPDYYYQASSFTDSTPAFINAVKYSLLNKTNIYLSSSINSGYGYYLNSEINLNSVNTSFDNPDSPTNVASFVGLGKNKTIIFWDNKANEILFSCYTTSGYPTTLSISGFTIYPINQNGAGTAFLISGTNQAKFRDLFIRQGTEIGFDLVNGKHGTWTELTDFSDVWIRYPTIAGINYRCRTVGDNGETNTATTSDSSFSGDTMNNVNIEVKAPSSAAIKINLGVHLYNSFWRTIINASLNSYFIYNNGVRNRSQDYLQMEGAGGVFTSNSYSVDGNWVIQSNTGILPDTSTGIFVIGNKYITNKTLLSNSLSDNGFPTVKINRVKDLSLTTPTRTFVGVTGDNIESIGFIGYGSGVNKWNGFGIFSSNYGDDVSAIKLRYNLSLGGIYSTIDTMVFDHYTPTFSSSEQFKITKSGLHRGKMGLMYNGTLSASVSPQTFTQKLDYLAYNSSFFLVITMKGTGIDYSQVWLTTQGRNANTANAIKLGNTINVGPSSGWVPPAAITIKDNGLMTTELTTPVDLTLLIQMVGIGVY